MHFVKFFATFAFLLGGAALAHQGVSNPVVKARMEVMGQIKDATSVIGNMAKGSIAFDSEKAGAAKSILLKTAKDIPLKFETHETDPKSEALPEIWQRWDDFVAMSDDMVKVVETIDVSNAQTLKASMGALGQSCGRCHKAYRLKK